MNTSPQKPGTPNKKQAAKELTQTIIKVLFYTIGGFIFYTTLVTGVALIVISFFNTDANFVAWIGTGAGLIAAVLLLNLVVTRIGSGKWKVTWPDLSFMGPY